MATPYTPRTWIAPGAIQTMKDNGHSVFTRADFEFYQDSKLVEGAWHGEPVNSYRCTKSAIAKCYLVTLTPGAVVVRLPYTLTQKEADETALVMLDIFNSRRVSF